MTPANYNALCAEWLVLKQLELDVMAACAVARQVKTDFDDGAFQDAISNLRAEYDDIRDQLDAYDAREEPSAMQMFGRRQQMAAE